MTDHPAPPTPTLAALVRERSEGISWKQARQLVEKGRVTVGGRVVTDPAARPQPGEAIEIVAVASARPAGGGDPEIRILHADADVAVVTKPAGMLTVPFEGDERDTLLARVRVILRRRETGPGGLTLRAVQRLDKETSGVLVFARNVTAQRDLQHQLSTGEMRRRYLALVHGEAENAVYDTLFVDDRGDGLRGSWGVFRAARGVHGESPAGAKRAVTGVRVLEALPGSTLVSCQLETGRQHQIRIHLAEAGHPVAGETVYTRDYRGAWLPAPRLLLHAASLSFLHPRTGLRVRFETPPPADFDAFVSSLRRRRPGPGGKRRAEGEKGA